MPQQIVSYDTIMEQIISSEPNCDNLIRSKIEFIRPPVGTNMARELVGAFKRHSSKVLLVDTPSKREWTGAQLLDTCQRFATNLIKLIQIKPNDIIMTICEHTGAEILAALGVVVAGGALFGTSPQDGLSEMKVLCELAAPSVIIASSRQHKIAIGLRENVASLRNVKIIWLDNPMKQNETRLIGLDGQKNYSKSSTSDLNNNTHYNQEQIDLNNNNTSLSIEQTIERDQVILFDDLINGPLDEQLIESVIGRGGRIRPDEQILTYMLTSGSTGRPKVVPSTHEELVYGLYSMISATKHKINANQYQLLPIGHDSIVSGDLPLDHGAGLNTMFLALYLGAKYIVMPSYDEDSFWQAVNDYRITSSVSSTTFGYKLFVRLKKLIDSGEIQTKWDLSSLKFISCAGAKLASIELIREVQRVFKQMHISQTYGCTEIGFISLVPANESLNDKYLSSTGYLMPGLLAKVVNNSSDTTTTTTTTTNCNTEQQQQDDIALGPMQCGEMLVWAQSKFKGYRCHVSDNSELIYANCHDKRGIFYKTGDKAHYDSDGRIYVHGRFKDTLCLMEDWKVLPAELEEVINEHPLVEQSAVVGVADAELPGCHKPRAFCKLISLESLDYALVAKSEDCELSARLAAQDFKFISEHIYNFFASRTAKPKHLTGGVRFVAEFPRVGLLNKIDRKALHQLD